MKAEIKIAVTDDHFLFRSGLVQLIESLGDQFVIVHQASNGIELQSLLKKNADIDIAIVDISMPQMDGFETADMLRQKFPDIKVLILTMDEGERSLIRMLKLGVKGYVSKDIEPSELKSALTDIVENGWYYNDGLKNNLGKILKKSAEGEDPNELSEKELIFVNLACSEDTYQDIARAMLLSPKTIDGYRASVFAKLGVKSRVGLVMHAIKNELVDVDQ